MKLFPYGPYPEVFVLRKWLDLEQWFVGFGGLPIGPEWRFFADAKHVICRHFYWSQESLKREPEPHRKLAAEMAESTMPQEAHVLAIEAVKCCGSGVWSVDFARAADGTLWIIDMATAERSWHPETCEHFVALRS